MDKQFVFEHAKKDITTILDGLTLENVESKQAQLMGYFGFIKSLLDLDALQTDVILESSPRDDSNEGMTAGAVPEEEGARKQIPLPKRTYRFQRNLKGGSLPELNNYYVPETIVRELNLQHGDIVEIDREEPYYEQTRYWFSIVERSNSVHPDRLQINHCVVETDAGRKVVRRIAGVGDIRVNEIPYTFVLSDEDVMANLVQEYDIVDIAYYKNKYNTARIIWKHDTTKLPQQAKTNDKAVETKKVNREDDKSESLANKLESVVDADMFKGKNILVVGAKPKEAGYRTIIEALGATVEVFAGTESKSRTRNAIQRSDVVVMVTAHLGHGASSGSPQVVELCKKAKKPFGFVDNMGNQSFILAVEEVLKREQQEKVLETV